jgi:hypothetical protein
MRLAALRPLQAGAIIAASDAFLSDRREQIAPLVAKQAIPAIDFALNQCSRNDGLRGATLPLAIAFANDRNRRVAEVPP